jgi:DNA-binding transcriptional MerR regulator
MSSTTTLGIGEVAARTGLSVHALRFYEQEGLLLHPVHRDGGGRRRYAEDDVDWVELITRLRASGMPLADVRRFAELVRAGPGNERERLELLRAHQDRVTAQLAELQRCHDLISWKVRHYDEHVSTGEGGDPWVSTPSPDGP